MSPRVVERSLSMEVMTQGNMKTVFKRTSVLKDCPTHYCPGCGHGIAHRLVAEVIDELGIRDRTIGIAPVGCAVLMYNYLDVDMIEVAHGRAPAVATGMKRTNPDKIVFSYQGDGDLAAIGTAEIIHAAHRGRAAHGDLHQQRGLRHDRRPDGPHHDAGPGHRDDAPGPPSQRPGLSAADLRDDGPAAGGDVRGTMRPEQRAPHPQTKAAIKHAFELQIEGAKGLSLVEVLSPCPTYWRMSPSDAMKWIEEPHEQGLPHRPAERMKRLMIVDV